MVAFDIAMCPVCAMIAIVCQDWLKTTKIQRQKQKEVHQSETHMQGGQESYLTASMKHEHETSLKVRWSENSGCISFHGPDQAGLNQVAFIYIYMIQKLFISTCTTISTWPHSSTCKCIHTCTCISTYICISTCRCLSSCAIY